MINLHIATETPDRPHPVVEARWYQLMTLIAGALLGIAVMWITSVQVHP